MARRLVAVVPAPVECNGCGCCCDPVVLGFSQAEAPSMGLHPDDLAWVLADLTPAGRDGWRRTAWIKEREAEVGEPYRSHHSSSVLRFQYNCRHFDRVTRACTNYEGRPPTCRVYPWVAEPVANKALPPPCSFRAELGQPVEELEGFLRRRGD